MGRSSAIRDLQSGIVYSYLMRIGDSLRGLGVPFDVFVIATERFEESKNIFGGIAYPANKYGHVICEAA